MSSIAKIIHELRVSGDPTEDQWADEIDKLRNERDACKAGFNLKSAEVDDLTKQLGKAKEAFTMIADMDSSWSIVRAQNLAEIYLLTRPESE